MRLKQFTFACLLTAMVMGIELLAATTGEILVVLTMLSTLPLYLLGRENTVAAVLSYLCTGLLLLGVNPHQCLFFAATNGLLGLVLGICEQKIKYGIASFLISSLALFGGTVAVAFAIGLFMHWWIPAVLFPFCFLYTGIYRLIAGKVYAKWLSIKGYCR